MIGNDCEITTNRQWAYKIEIFIQNLLKISNQ